MKRLVVSKKRMIAVGGLLLSFTFTPIRAQQPLVLDLDKALEFAMSESPTVKVADVEIEKKKYAKKGAYAALFPQLNFSADYSRTLKKQVMYMDGAFDMGSMLTPIMDPIKKGTEQTFIDTNPNYKPGTLDQNITANTPPPVVQSGSEGIEMGRDNSWSYGFSASMPLVNASLWKSLTISGMDVELAIEQARSSKIDMVNQVKKSFFGVLLANDSYRVFKESYDNAFEKYTDIKKKYDQGLVAEYDLIRADVAVRNVEPSMLQAENMANLAEWQLKALLGMDLEIEIDCEGKLMDFQSALIGDYLSTETDLDHNTNLKQLDIQRGQLGQMLKMQKFDFLPTLSISGVYQWSAVNNDFKFKDYNWNPYSMVGISLSMPIFTGGSRVQKIKQTKVSMVQLDLQREDLARNLQLAVKQSKDNMTTCVKRFDAAQKGVKQADRGYIIAQKRYDTGAGTLLEMNDAELALTQARLNLNQSVYDYMVAQADMEKIVGKQVN